MNKVDQFGDEERERERGQVGMDWIRVNISDKGC